MNDFELLERWLAGDALAGNRLCARHINGVRGYFSTRAGDAAEDLVQATFEALARDCHRFEGRASFRAYLFAIAHHQLCRHFRRKTRALRQLEHSDPEGIGDDTQLPSTPLLRAERSAAVRGAMKTLSPSHRELLELYYWEEAEVDELALSMAIAPATVRTRLFRGRAALRGALDGLAREAHMTPALFTATA